MKGTLKCIRLHPIMQELFNIEPTGHSFGQAEVEFTQHDLWDDCTDNFQERIYITKINGKEIPKQLAWADRISTTCNLKFELNGNMFVIENITE